MDRKLDTLIDSLLESQKIGIVIYGSLFRNEGILSHYLCDKYYEGPKLKISFNGCNPFKQNLTRVLDYKNGEYMKTYIKIFDNTLGLEQVKRYIALREGNINYVTYYKYKTNELINVPDHITIYKKEIKKELNQICKKIKLDYLFIITYPPKIENINNYIKQTDNILDNSKNYLSMCCKKTLSNVEKNILNN